MANRKASLEVIGVVASLAATALAFTAYIFPGSRLAAILVLLPVLLWVGIWSVRQFRAGQMVQVVHGYKETLNLLEQLIADASSSVWTVRTHIGEASAEEALFKVLANRVRDHNQPLEDVRRIIRLTDSAATRNHLISLIRALSGERVVKVKYFVGVGPKYDFIVIDGKLAVIGLPRSDADLVGASIVVRDLTAVRCIESAFEDLWGNSTLLFKGDSGRDPAQSDSLIKQLDVAIGLVSAELSLPPGKSV